MVKNLDDVLKKFEKEANKAVSKDRNSWNNTEEDDLYDVDIHIWRKPGMGNSVQSIVGNKISIMTATTSYLRTLVDKKVITLDELDDMIGFIKNMLNN